MLFADPGEPDDEDFEALINQDDPTDNGTTQLESDGTLPMEFDTNIDTDVNHGENEQVPRRVEIYEVKENLQNRYSINLGPHRGSRSSHFGFEKSRARNEADNQGLDQHQQVTGHRTQHGRIGTSKLQSHQHHAQ